MDIIYKILTPLEWQEFQKNSCFKGSKLDQKDGFIHTALKDQYPAILTKFFKQTRPLILVKINSNLLANGSLKIEANQAGGNKYPHIYGKIPLKAVIDHQILD